MKSRLSILITIFTGLWIYASGNFFANAFADGDSGKMMAKTESPQAVEKRITELHTKLKITDAQEEQWKAVTAEMRGSAKAMMEMNEGREKGSRTMTALDDLKSYSEIANLHAESMKKFLDAFTPLYNSMTDDQKKNADEVFRGHKDAKRKAK